MTFQEKLRRLGAEVNKAKVSRAAGLKPNTLSTYIAVGSIPRADIALKIARALKVPLDWLVDPQRDWPPPSSAAAASNLSDEELRLEVARRYQMGLLNMLDFVDHLERTPWEDLARDLYRHELGVELPPAYARFHELSWLFTTALHFARSSWDARLWAEQYRDQLPGRQREPNEVTMQNLANRLSSLTADHPAVRLVSDYWRMREDYRASDARQRAKLESQREKIMHRLGPPKRGVRSAG